MKFELYEGVSRTHFTPKVAATWERDLPEAFPPTILKGAVPREKDDDDDGARTWGKPRGGSEGSVRGWAIRIVPGRKTAESSACSARSSLSFRGAPKL